MNENYRHRQLLDLLTERKALSTQEIIELLGISPATARRDINKLSEQGRLHKVRNGAEAISVGFIPSNREIKNNDEKQRIAEAASKLCKEGDSVVLTCGSTMSMLGSRLCGQRLQIITNYLPLANHLIDHNHDDVVILGGQYNKNKAITLSISGNEMSYAANIMFTSGKGFTLEGLYKTDMIIAHSENQMSSKAQKYVVLLDSIKLGKRVGMLLSELSKIDILITGSEADPEIIKQLREKGLEVILA
ncbi:HTH-type transcriptional regulator UlaR [Glaesserella parasuis]|uniref:HTH-type transcriptional regulator UlaR n=1 Tax=Glaesserella parasuis TaxID=738 RepID=A0AAX1M560_GLAPU|nr:HTH-type transcriptional regulator UlaR [Glaesserella parasuis]MCT8560454.1 HTH-type transcriptional regulator UlaR [Glaesserella parasuis]MCT8582800.1 HTH-type transcriptional regulator UlaR [Glaesserella parasuis]MCT8586940.1 HTH-type transcriptional regulator UlaR [Glaesserella parasuis]MCT8641626.1 HTH-type transcriptional regulator UlaR [Glaesserella parasuis]MCT8651625.1 HTH-type transcriptional regulator UlaR [Glaesserella parasuis]